MAIFNCYVSSPEGKSPNIFSHHFPHLSAKKSPINWPPSPGRWLRAFHDPWAEALVHQLTSRCFSTWRKQNETTKCYLVAHPTNRKWVITPLISGLTLLIPFITGVITHLLSYVKVNFMGITLWLCQQFAIEHGHWNSGFTHWKWWFSIAMTIVHWVGFVGKIFTGNHMVFLHVSTIKYIYIGLKPVSQFSLHPILWYVMVNFMGITLW